MRISTRVEFVWDGQQYVRVHEEGYNLPDGAPLALLKGAEANQKNIAKNQQDFYGTLQQDYGKTFANQQGVLNSLTNSLTPILQGGPGQYGFGAQQDAALRTQANQGTAASYNAARQATGEQLAAGGGGNTMLPNGTTDELKAQNANAAAAQQSNQQLGITQAGYQQGEKNYDTALSGLSGVASMQNPNGLASESIGAGSSAFNSANQIAQLDAQANPWNTIAPILGGAAGAVLGPAETALGNQLAGKVSGGGSQ